uniref:cDNA n=1 Tax=Panagrellus redivivus TaxID=6233 RepID=A0A7E4VXF6_PANRE
MIEAQILKTASLSSENAKFFKNAESLGPNVSSDLNPSPKVPWSLDFKCRLGPQLSPRRTSHIGEKKAALQVTCIQSSHRSALEVSVVLRRNLGPGSGAKIRVLGPGSGAEAPKLWLRLRYFKMAPSGLRRSQLWGPWLSKQSWTKPGSATLQTRPLVLLSPEKFTELSWKSLKNLSPKDAFSGC